MKDGFAPRLDVLPPAQRRLWRHLSQVPPEFVLYGGTAVALHLGHRQSVDFDFFGMHDFDPQLLAGTIPFLADALIIQQARNTLTASVGSEEPVRVSFFGLPRFARLTAPHSAADNGLAIAGLLDLSGTKAAVVQQRAEAKDYLDLDAILQDGRIDLPVALAAARAIYGPSFNPQITLKALSYFSDGDLARLDRAVQDRLAGAARRVDLDRLPTIVPA